MSNIVYDKCEGCVENKSSGGPSPTPHSQTKVYRQSIYKLFGPPAKKCYLHKEVYMYTRQTVVTPGLVKCITQVVAPELGALS